MLVHLTWVRLETGLIVAAQRLATDINITLTGLRRQNIVGRSHIAGLVRLARMQRSLGNNLRLNGPVVVWILIVERNVVGHEDLLVIGIYSL